MCSIDAAGPCPGVGQTCEPVFEMQPVGNEDVGVCVAPAVRHERRPSARPPQANPSSKRSNTTRMRRLVLSSRWVVSHIGTG